MRERFEYQGYWWLPHALDHRVPVGFGDDAVKKAVIGLPRLVLETRRSLTMMSGRESGAAWLRGRAHRAPIDCVALTPLGGRASNTIQIVAVILAMMVAAAGCGGAQNQGRGGGAGLLYALGRLAQRKPVQRRVRRQRLG